MAARRNKLIKFKFFLIKKYYPHKTTTFKKAISKSKMMIVHYQHKMMKYSKKSDYKKSMIQILYIYGDL